MQGRLTTIQTKKKRVKEIRVYPEKCAGCLGCQLACSLAYEQTFNPLKARIVINWIGDIDREISFTDECNHCGICVQYCNYGALEEI